MQAFVRPKEKKTLNKTLENQKLLLRERQK